MSSENTDASDCLREREIYIYISINTYNTSYHIFAYNDIYTYIFIYIYIDIICKYLGLSVPS